MSASNTRTRAHKPIPRWLIFLAVVVTAGTTIWAMSETNLRGPHTSWDQAQGAVEQVWAEPGAPPAGAAVEGATLGGAVDPEMAGAARAVAGLPGVPLISFRSRRPHADRGACTICHGVLTGDGTPLPAIHSFSSMPHAFRGNCTNCHQITIGRGLTGSPVAATMMAPPDTTVPMQPMMQQPQMVPQQMMQPVAPQQLMPQQMMQPVAPQQMMPQQQMMQPVVPQQMAPQAMMPQQMVSPVRPPPNEADWRGMEVRPGAQGVVVTNAEGAAARSGLQPGDLVTSINGANIRDMTNFVDATQNGNLMQGTVVVRRGEQRLAFEMQPRVNEMQPGNGMGAMAGPMAVN